LSGKTLSFAEIEFEGNENLIGKFLKVRIDKFTNLLQGSVIE